MIVTVACSWAEDSEPREQSSSAEIDLEAFRAGLRKMTDEELICHRKVGRYRCPPMANFGKLPHKVFVV